MVPVDPILEKAELEERNRLILVNTLGVISYLYATFSVVVGLMLLGAPPHGEGLYASRTFGALHMAHAVLLGGAGAALRRRRSWAWLASFLAAAGAAFFVTLYVRRSNWTNGALDGLYALLVLVAFFKARPRA